MGEERRRTIASQAASDNRGYRLTTARAMTAGAFSRSDWFVSLLFRLSHGGKWRTFLENDDTLMCRLCFQLHISNFARQEVEKFNLYIVDKDYFIRMFF